MAFSGTADSDFEKLSTIPEKNKPDFINFGIGPDFLSWKSLATDYLNSVYPDDYNYFIESDYGEMIIELLAGFAAVLNTKAEFLASQKLLRLAKTRKSVSDLLELIGQKFRGPTAAIANATLTLENTPSWWSSPASDADRLDPVTFVNTNRTVSVTSPEDAGPVNYTLYKITSTGQVEDLNSNGSLLFYGYEADNAASSVFTNCMWLEGAMVIAQGSFTRPDPIKFIKLEEGPVIENSVQVYVDSPNLTTSGAYREVDNIYYASGSADKVFQVAYDADFNATIIFGDGVAGVSPPTGATFIITYRVGGGTRGNAKREYINSIKTVYGLSDSVNRTIQVTGENSVEFTGGTNAQTVENAKKYLPLNFRAQNRCVTLDDYTSYVNTWKSPVGSTAKGRAVTRDSFSSANVIDIYLLEKASNLQLKRATTDFKISLLSDLELRKMATDEVVLVDGLIRTADIILEIGVDRYNKPFEDGIKRKVVDEVIRYFDIDNMDFGKRLVLADLSRAIFTRVSEVLNAKVTNFSNDISVSFNEIIQLNNLTVNVVYL